MKEARLCGRRNTTVARFVRQAQYDRGKEKRACKYDSDKVQHRHHRNIPMNGILEDILLPKLLFHRSNERIVATLLQLVQRLPNERLEKVALGVDLVSILCAARILLEWVACVNEECAFR